MIQGMEWNFKPSLKRFGTNFVSEHNRYDITCISREVGTLVKIRYVGMHRISRMINTITL